jgi:tyrosine-protein kinase Etk/Wzc
MTDYQNDARASKEHEVDLVDVLIVLFRRKKQVILVPLCIAILVALASLTMPNIYKASTSILPPQQSQSGAAGLLAQFGGVASIAGVSGLKNPADLYVGMLRSRTIADKLIKKYDLTNVYGVDSVEKARAELTERTSVLSSKDGLITVSVEDESPARSAELANEYVKELFALTNVLAVTEAGQRRMFFERQFEATKNNLANAELNLKRSLSTRGVISVDMESRAIIETVSRLRAQVASKEIQLRSAGAFLTPEHQNYKQLQQELASLRVELSKLENGSESQVRGAKNAHAGRQSYEGLENVKILRELKYQQLLYEMLAKQYEAARLDEAKQAPIVQVLDTAIPSQRKAGPKRAMIVIASYVLSLLIVIVFVFVQEAKRKAMLLPERAHKWAELKALI